MDKIVTKGIICLKDNYNFIYRIANIDYVEFDNGKYSYYFYPYYNVIDMLDSSCFQGIPGLDLSKRKKCYERNNMTPVFISERTPSPNRVDLFSLLSEQNMKSLNRLEWLIKTDTYYSGDRLFVIERKDNKELYVKVDSMFDLVKKSNLIIKELLKIICNGGYLDCKEISLNDKNRLDYYKLLMPIYVNSYELKRIAINKGIEIAKKESVYKGRKKKSIDPILFEEIFNDYINKSISLKKASKILNVSESTFLRRIKNKKEEI